MASIIDGILSSTRALLADHGIIASAPDMDREAVQATVGRFARKIGCDLSNQAAAVSWALKYGRNTMDACRVGRERACTLLNRQNPPPPNAA